MYNDILTLYCYSTGEEIRELTELESHAYEQMIEHDQTGVGAVPGDRFGVPGVTVYAA